MILTGRPKDGNISSMDETIRILTTEFDGDDGLIVTFSDGTTGAYVVEELLELRPFRDRTKTVKIEKCLGTNC